MKNKASHFLKKIMSLLSSVAKAKSVAVKSKTSAVKARLIKLSSTKSKKVLLGSISNKIHGILGPHYRDSQDDDIDVGDQSKAIVLYNAVANEPQSSCTCTQLVPSIDVQEDHGGANDDDDDNKEDDKYPDLTHSLFDEENFDDPGGSIIELVKNSKEDGEDFSLEDEIDHVADLFIMRFHKRIRLQKLESFKRYQQMLARSV